jgi:hypothetical protein
LAGCTERAKALFERLLGLRNGLGLLSEEYDPNAHRLVGNFRRGVHARRPGEHRL